METAVKPVQNGRGRKRRWPAEQKLAVGLGHHRHPGVEWTEGALGHHDRLRGPDGADLALRHTHHGRGSGRDAAGGRVHGSLRVTPAMQAGITDHVWSLGDLITA